MVLASFLSAISIVFPGMIVARLLDARARSLSAFFVHSVVWSLLIASIPAWVPMGSRIPLEGWTYFIAALDIAGAFCFYLQVRDNRASGTHREWDRTAIIFAVLAFAVYGTISLVRPVIDWDAITYYLSVAVQWFKTGHVTDTLYPYLTTVPNSPDTVPPMMPSVYTLALYFAHLTHERYVDSVRLLPLVFAGGTFFATKRLGERFFSPNFALLSACLWLVLPSTIGLMTTVPLYLDLGTTFLFASFLDELLSTTRTKRRFVMMAAIASATVIFKIDGLALIGLAVIGVLIVRLGSIAGRILALASVAVLAGLAYAVGYLNAYPLGLILAFVVCTVLLLLAAGAREPRRLSDMLPPNLQACAAILIALVPAVLFVIHLMMSVGSPVGMYVPQWAHSLGKDWLHAVVALNRANLNTTGLIPGLPGAYGAELVLSWEFAPLIGAIALAGALYAIWKQEPLAELAAIVLMCDVAFITIFHFQSMRHLLPTTPAIAVLAFGGINAFGTSARRRTAALCVAAASIVPFAWAAEQIFFDAALPLLRYIQWDQWHLEFAEIIGTLAIFVVCIATGALIVWPPARRLRNAAIAAAAVLFVLAIFFTDVRTPFIVAALVLAAAFGASHLIAREKRTIPLLAVVAVVAMFWPVIYAGIDPGYKAQARSVLTAEDYGYYRVLRTALEDPGMRRLLTFQQYGIAWFSLGRIEDIELDSATDLAYYKHELRGDDIPNIFRALGTQGAITPLYGKAAWNAYRRALQSLDAQTLVALDDPLVSHPIAGPAQRPFWLFLKPYDGTSLAGSPRITVRGSGADPVVLSDRNAVLGSVAEIQSLEVGPIPAPYANAATRVTLQYSDLSAGEWGATKLANIDGTIEDGTLSIPASKLASAIAPLRDALLLEIQIAPRAAKGKSYDFRSPGTVVSTDGHRVSVAGPTFVLRPENGIVADIFGTAIHGPFNLYPGGPPSSISDTTSLSMDLRTSPTCINPARARAWATVIAQSGKKTEVPFVPSPASNNVKIALATLTLNVTPANQPLPLTAISSIRVSADAADCRVDEVMGTRAPLNGFFVLRVSR